MSQIGNLVKFLEGTAIMADSLKTYHDGKAALKSCYGKKDLPARVSIVKKALKNYRVIVSPAPEDNTTSDGVRIFRPDNKLNFLYRKELK